MERTIELTTTQPRLQITQARVIHLNEETRQVRHVISTSALDRMGRVVELNGWKLTNYRANPLVFADHDYNLEKVIGRGVDTKIEGDSLVSTTEFHNEGLGNVAFRMVQAGLVRAWSVGWRGVKAHYSDQVEGDCGCKEIAKKSGREYVQHFMQHELLEYSLVTIPANPDAVMGLQAAGLVEKAEAEEWIDSYRAAADAPEDRRFSVSEIAKAFGVPEKLINEERIAAFGKVLGTESCRVASEGTVDTAASTDAAQPAPAKLNAAEIDGLLAASRFMDERRRVMTGGIGASMDEVVAALQVSDRVRGITKQQAPR